MESIQAYSRHPKQQPCPPLCCNFLLSIQDSSSRHNTLSLSVVYVRQPRKYNTISCFALCLFDGNVPLGTYERACGACRLLSSAGPNFLRRRKVFFSNDKNLWCRRTWPPVMRRMLTSHPKLENGSRTGYVPPADGSISGTMDGNAPPTAAQLKTLFIQSAVPMVGFGERESVTPSRIE